MELFGYAESTFFTNFQPSIDWHNRLELDKIIYADENHDLYTKSENARRISDLILNQGVIHTK